MMPLPRMVRRAGRATYVIVALFPITVNAQSGAPRAIVGARAHTVAMHDSLRAWKAVGAATASARVIGLGEATHGQHEAFDVKRRMTMHLIRHHGIRVVAYEASATRARDIDTWIRGEGDSATVPMRGFGMLIWDVQENAALLRDLRAWNRTARPDQRVRFIGVDAQDGEAVVARLRVLLGDRQRALIGQIDSVSALAPAALQRMFQGARASFDSLTPRVDSVVAALRVAAEGDQHREELLLRTSEWRANLTMYGAPSGRDRAMADLLLQQLQPTDRAVVWGHNEHVKRGPLSYLGSTELAMGGHLAQSIGDAYYAIGFAFGSGAFQANAPDVNGRWGYRQYRQGLPPRGSLEDALLASVPGDVFFNIRSVPATSPFGRWLHEPHGARWWGGYNVPDDPDARTQNASQLLHTTLARDYDGFVFIRRTTAAIPMDTARLLRVR